MALLQILSWCVTIQMGKIDSSFAINGIVITNINETDSPTGGIALQADGKIVLGITVDSDVIPEGYTG